MRRLLRFFPLLFVPFLILLLPSRLAQVSATAVWSLDKESLRLSLKRTDLGPAPVVAGFFFRPPFLVRFNGNGTVTGRVDISPLSRLSTAADGSVWAAYGDYGKRVRLGLSGGGERFVRSDSYPLVSAAGRYVLFVTGEAEGLRLYDASAATFGSNVLSGDLILDIHSGRSNFYGGTMQGFYLKLSPVGTRELPDIRSRRFRQAASGIPIVKRVCVSGDERRVACLSGLYPEYIYVYDNLRDRLIARFRTKENRRGKAFLGFSPSDRRLLEENRTGFAVHLVRGIGSWTYDDPAWLGKRYFSAAWIDERTLFVTVTTRDGTTRLQIIERGGRRLWDEAVGADWGSVRRVGNGYILLETDREVRLIRTSRRDRRS